MNWFLRKKNFFLEVVVAKVGGVYDIKKLAAL